MQKPIIGITLDFDTKKTSEGGYSDFPWYALRIHYEKAVANHGGVPILIPYQENLIKQYVELCDGFIFPGGDYDIHPSYYGEEVKPNINISSNDRTNFEMELMKEVLKRDIPMLGICAGQQLLNVVQSGTLYQHINDFIKTDIQHKHGYQQDINWHMVDITPNSLLSRIVGTSRYMINSHHHQSIRKVGKNLIVNAVAPDGVIEGVEHTEKKFCLAILWHPEYEKNKEDSKIFEHFIQACK
jgi:putative glutamine amidotransferase